MANPYSEGAQRLMDDGNVLGAVVMAGMGQTADMSQQLLDSYQRQIKELKAELHLTRVGVLDCYRNPWVPQFGVVQEALFPSRHAIEAFVAAGEPAD